MLIHLLALLAATTAVQSQSLASESLIKDVPALPLGLYRHLQSAQAAQRRSDESEYAISAPDQIPFLSNPLQKPSSSRFRPHLFDQLVSHDPDVPAPSGSPTFQQRFWFDASHYRKGGPVYLLDAGETDATGRLPFLESGILKILSEATGGIGIVFEHRYCELRVAVSAARHNLNFSLTRVPTCALGRRRVFPGQEPHDRLLPVPHDPSIDPRLELLCRERHSPWSRRRRSPPEEDPLDPVRRELRRCNDGTREEAVPGNLVGRPRVERGHDGNRRLLGVLCRERLVSFALLSYANGLNLDPSQPIQEHAPKECISQLENHTAAIDSILAVKNSFLTSSLKSYFGLPNVTSDVDFANALTLPLGSWQARNWDPKVGSKTFYRFCEALTANSTSSLDLDLDFLPKWPSNPRKQLAAFSNYATYVKEHIASRCPEGVAQDDCFGTDLYEGDGIEEAPWKSWAYQFCTGECLLLSFCLVRG